MKTPYRNDLQGKKFNRLTVQSFSHMDKNNGAMWNCVCDCGEQKVVGGSRLKLGLTKSCGCAQREAAGRKHGMYGQIIYRRWAMMKHRCKDLNDPVYGGRGIGYDPRWEAFTNFYDDMSEGFSEDLEIDRIDVNKGYYKDNCRWVTHNENNYNKNRQSNNISGRTGVSIEKRSGRFRAYITKDRKQINLGYFGTYEEAVQARELAEIEIYGYNRS